MVLAPAMQISLRGFMPISRMARARFFVVRSGSGIALRSCCVKRRDDLARQTVLLRALDGEPEIPLVGSKGRIDRCFVGHVGKSADDFSTFKDEADADAMRLADPVAPARRSQAALAKVHTRTLADGTPAMSFTRLLAHLATIVRNTLRPRSARPGEATFTLTTRPTLKQQQALDLVAAISSSR
jgi:hypothetical protein